MARRRKDSANVEALAEAFRDTARENPHRLRDHLEALNDGIIAIYITVMVLEVPPPASADDYGGFLASLAVFAVSFFVVASFWWENHRLFTVTEEADHRFMVANFAFLCALATVPVMTKWVMTDLTPLSAANYGAAYFLTYLMQFMCFAFSAMSRADDLRLFARRAAGRVAVIVGLNAALIAVGLALPQLAMVAYVALPIASFLMPQTLGSWRRHRPASGGRGSTSA